MQEREELKHLLVLEDVEITKCQLYIWGTGNTAQLYYEGLLRLEEEGFFIQGYCDNDPRKWGTVFNGKPVLSPEELVKIKNIYVLICSPQVNVIKAVGHQLNVKGIKWDLIDRVIFSLHSEDILKCYDLLSDVVSKKVYVELVRCRTTGERPKPEFCFGNPYFALPDFEEHFSDECFVDCGAYVGDTLEQYVWKKQGIFHKIVAFEPDKGNYVALEARVERLKREWNRKQDDIMIYPYGVGEQMMESGFSSYHENNGLGSKFVSCESKKETCRIVALDEMLDVPVSFLKADIESYEYKMLLGARKILQTYRPKIAVCIYHNGVDFYSILLLLHELVPEYKFAIRHHSHNTADTVLYAWVD